MGERVEGEMGEGEREGTSLLVHTYVGLMGACRCVRRKNNEVHV